MRRLGSNQKYNCHYRPESRSGPLSSLKRVQRRKAEEEHEDCKAGLIHYLFHLRLGELHADTGPQLRSRNVISFGHTSNSKVHTNARVRSDARHCYA